MHSAREGGAPKRRMPLLAGAASLILVAGAIAGVVYVADPTIFGDAELDKPVNSIASQAETRSNVDAEKSSIDLEQNIDPSQPAAQSAEAHSATIATRRNPETQSRQTRNSGQGKAESGDDEGDTIVNVQVDDPEVPKGGMVFTDRDERGRMTMLRVNPKAPSHATKQQQEFEVKGFNPFPQGFDFKSLSPAQRRRVQQMLREKQLNKAYGVPPTRPRPSPPPSPQ